MGAGLSKKQFNNRVHSLLKRTQRELEKAGVKSAYKNYQLCADLTQAVPKAEGFNISYRRLNASNGEFLAGIPMITVYLQDGTREEYGFWNSKHGDWAKGIARIVEIFANRSTPDFYVQNEGSIFLLHPLSEAGREWLREHISEDGVQYFGNALVVEHRYISEIVAGIASDGLIVE